MGTPDEEKDLDFTGIFRARTAVPAAAPAPKHLPADIVIGARTLKKGGYFVNLTHPRAKRAVDPATTTVLVVEDDPSTLVLLDRLLTRAGYRTRKAPDGAAFVAMMKLPPVPDLILLDLELPDVSGFKILARLRQHPRTRQVPVVILSARSEPSDVFQGISLGADGYITKPTKSGILMQAVNAVLGA